MADLSKAATPIIMLAKPLTPACHRQVDAVMVSCSCFAPTPSMAAMLVNRFRFREDVLTYNLSGMGCSSSLVCVDLAKHLLKVPTSSCCKQSVPQPVMGLPVPLMQPVQAWSSSLYLQPSQRLKDAGCS